MIVVDCSVALSFTFADEQTAYALAVADDLRRNSAIAPSLFRIEVANVLRTQEKRGRFDRTIADEFLRRFDALPIRYFDPSGPWFSPASLIHLQRRHNLTSYDALYLLLTLSQGAALATLDKALAAAAQAEHVYFQAPS